MFMEIAKGVDLTWATTAVIGFFTYLMVRLWIRKRSLPPGPTPLPIVGNILHFVGKESVNVKAKRWRAKYGDIFTVWLGPDPMVVVCGWDLIKEGLISMKNAFSGRKVRFSTEIFLDGHQDVILSDFSPLWSDLRKIITLAIRKYSVSENLPILVDDVLKQVVPMMIEKNEAFDPKDFLYLTIYNILANTAFGKRYTMEDEEFLALKDANDQMNKESSSARLQDVFPFLKYILKYKTTKLKNIIRQLRKPIEDQYDQHLKTYKKGIIRDFTDACIAAKEEAEEEDRDSAAYFTKGNMVLVVTDLFGAGSDTTRVTLTWILLYIANYPEVQERIRREVQEQIGDRIPVQEDKRKCPYTAAVITEVLRIRPIVAFTLEHKATRDSEFAGYQIPKETSIIFNIFSQHMDPANFEEPEAFRPERFLEEDGTFMTTSRVVGYFPFGLGRRACPGEKLALNDLFLLLTGLLQKCRVSMPDGPGTADFEPMDIVLVNMPKEQKIKIQKL